MKIIYFVIYNGLVYPVVFWTALIISVFNKKLRQSIKGKFDSINIIKNYFNKIDISSNIYWFHSSSLGEFFQVKTVIEKLKEEQDDLICIVSFSSPSGFNHANSDAMDLKFYIPFDFPWTINGVLNMIKPKKIMFASYDLWPNLIWISRLKGIHVNLYSVKTKEGFLRENQISQHIYRSIYSSLSSLYTISEKDMKNVCDILGSNPGPKLRVVGNPRYDLVMSEAIEFRQNDAEKLNDRDMRIIIGSAHKEEEDYLVPALVQLMNENPDLKVLYALHEPTDSALREIKKKFHLHGIMGAVFRKKKDLKLPNNPLVILGVVGVLSRLYWQGQIAYVGGGHSTGVHNVMEPAVARLPVIFGPRYHNSHEAEELINNSGGFCVKDEKEFLSIMKNLISDSKYLKMTSLLASDVVYKNVGSTREMVQQILCD